MKRHIYCMFLLISFSINASEGIDYENNLNPKLLRLSKEVLNSQHTAIQLKEEILRVINKNLDIDEKLILSLEKITPNIFQEGNMWKIKRIEIRQEINSFTICENNVFLNKILSAEESNRNNNLKQFDIFNYKSFSYMN